MKKLAVILSVILSVSLCACRENNPRSTSGASSASQSAESISRQTQREETSSSGQKNPYAGLKEAFDGEYTVGELMSMDGENGSLTIYDTKRAKMCPLPLKVRAQMCLCWTGLVFIAILVRE